MTTGVIARPAGQPRLRWSSQPDGAFSLEALLLVAALFGTAFGAPTLVSNFIPADVAIFGLIFMLAASIVFGRTAIEREVHQLLLGMLVMILGSVIAAAQVGVQPWVIAQMVRDFGAIAALFAAVNAFRHLPARFLNTAVLVVAVATVVLAAQLLLDNDIRASATFENPNLPAHFLATAIGVLAFTTRGRSRVVLMLAAFAGLVTTGSFGAALQLAAMAGYFMVAHRRTAGHVLRSRPLVGVVAALAVILALAAFVTLRGGAEDSSRIDRSSSVRVEIWTGALRLAAENPMGVGPGTAKELDLLPHGHETHNDFLAFAGERGVIGLAGLLLFGAGLFRLGHRGGPARMLVVGFAVASMFRETLNFRHLWLFLALLYVWEELQAAESPGTVVSQAAG